MSPAPPDLSPESLAAVVALLSDAVVTVDAEQRIVYVNDGAVAMFGHAREEMVGQPLDLLLPEGVRAAHRGHVGSFDRESSAARLMGERRPILGRRRDGTLFPAEASIVKAGTPEKRLYTALVRDITERRRMEETLAEHASVVRELLDIASATGGPPDAPIRALLAMGRWRFHLDGGVLARGARGVLEATWVGGAGVVDEGARIEAASVPWGRAIDAGGPVAGDRWIAAQVFVEGRPYGVLAFTGATAPPAFVAAHLDIVRLMAHWAGQAVERMHTEEETRLLAEAGRVLAQSLDYEETLARVCQIAVSGLADCSMVDVREESQQLAQDDAHRALLRSLAPRSHMAVPLVVRDSSGTP